MRTEETKDKRSEASSAMETWGIFFKDTPSASASSPSSFIPEYGDSGNSESGLKEQKLTVVIIAKNEEEKIEDCLKSLSWADEVIMVDSGSTDKTAKIAKKHKAKVFFYQGGNFSDWRNEGLKRAKGDWILYVDADEKVIPSLRDEINQLINKPINQFTSYAIPRRNIILGKEMKHGGWWPDYVKRLYKKSALKGWTGELHEEPVYEGQLGHLKNPLLHLKEEKLSEMMEKTNEWSEIEAKLLFKSGHPKMNIFRFASAMLREFWLRMICHAAFLDGGKGVIYAIYQVWSKFITYAKLWEKQLKSKNKI